LEIIRKRDDGYHIINSLFVPLPLADELEVTIADNYVTMEWNEKLHRADHSNLCMRAATAMKNYFSISAGAHISLKKNIPIGAGMGGGSSDAATTLIALNSLWNINAASNSLHEIAKNIGADVPFFLYNSAAVVGGIGDRVEQVDFILASPLLLVCPEIHISTAWAYAQVQCDERAQETPYRALVEKNIALSEYPRVFRNEFEKYIFSSYTELSSIKNRLLESGAGYASLTGSGSGLFGIFDSTEKAERARASFSEYRTFFFLP